MTELDNQARCAAAASDQGLDPVIAALEEAGLPFALENTGGYCMAVVIDAEPGHIAMTSEEPGRANLGVYPFADWQNGSEAIEYQEDLAVERIPNMVQRYLSMLDDFHAEAVEAVAPVASLVLDVPADGSLTDDQIAAFNKALGA